MALSFSFFLTLKSGVNLSKNAPGSVKWSYFFCYYLAKSQNIMCVQCQWLCTFEVLKYFSRYKKSFLLFATLWWRDFKLKNLMFFSEALACTAVGVIKQGCYSPQKFWFVGEVSRICVILENMLMIIGQVYPFFSNFSVNFYNWSYRKFFL